MKGISREGQLIIHRLRDLRREVKMLQSMIEAVMISGGGIVTDIPAFLAGQKASHREADSIPETRTGRDQ